MNNQTIETRIQKLGEAKIPSPMLKEELGGIHHLFVSDEDQIMINIKRTDVEAMFSQASRPQRLKWPAHGEKSISMPPNSDVLLRPAVACARD